MDLTLLPSEAAQPSGLDRLHKLFVTNVEHELRTPLTVAQGYAELLYAGELGPLNAEQQSAVKLMVDRLHGMSGLIDRITTLLAVEAGLGLRAPVEMDDVLKTVLEPYWAIANEQGQYLELVVADDLPSVLGDELHLRQAFDCLLENAARFTPPGGRICVEVVPGDQAVQVTISDTGRGISPEQQARLFSGFYQCDMSSTRQYGGLGLGLTIAKAVVDAHGGQLSVSSAAGQGATFTAVLPAQAVSQAAALPTTLFAQPVMVIDRLCRILIVDDDPSVLFTFESALEQLPNCEVLTASSGEQALRLLAEQEIDLLVTDYQMPDMDGLTLAWRLRQASPTTAVLMITAYSTQELRHQAQALQIEQVLDKPVGLMEIRNAALAALVAR